MSRSSTHYSQFNIHYSLSQWVERDLNPHPFGTCFTDKRSQPYLPPTLIGALVPMLQLAPRSMGKFVNSEMLSQLSCVTVIEMTTRLHATADGGCPRIAHRLIDNMTTSIAATLGQLVNAVYSAHTHLTFGGSARNRTRTNGIGSRCATVTPHSRAERIVNSKCRMVNWSDCIPLRI